MGRIINLAILAFLLYLAFDKGWPLIQQQLGQGVGFGSDADNPAARCVLLADRANDTFGESFGRVGGPGSDPGAWTDFMGRVEADIDGAESRCTCAQLACRKATEAMSLLRTMLREYDDRFRGNVGMPRDPARRLLAVNELLNEARGLARQGK